MTVKKVTYVEPAGYFTPEMLKIAREWDEKHKVQEQAKNASKKAVPSKKKTK